MKADHQLNLTSSNRDGQSVNYTATVNSLKSEETEKLYNITVAPTEITKVKDNKLQYLCKHSNISGFRPGKAPISFIWNKHKDELTFEIIDEIVNMIVNGISNDEKLNIISTPKLSKEEFDLDKGIKFEVTLSTLPEINFPDFTKISIEKPVYEITDADVKGRIDKLLTIHKKHEEAKKTHKAELGDQVTIDFEGKIDGTLFAGGAAKGHSIELGSHSFIDNFEEQIIGHKMGDEFVVNVNFPADYHAAEFAGKAAEFAVNLHKISQARNLKDEAELLEVTKIPSSEDLHLHIKNALERECANVQNMKMKSDLLDKLDAAFSVTIPQVMLDEELANLAKSEALVKETNEKELSKLADRRVKLGILLAELAKAQSITVEKDDINKAIIEKVQAAPSQAYAQAMIKYYTENKQAIENLKGPIIEHKTVQYLFDQVKNIEKPISIKALLELED